MTSPTVRLYRAGDAPALARVFFDSIRGATERHYSRRQREAWAPSMPESAEWTARLDQQIVFVAEIDSRIVGFMTLREDGYIDLAFVEANAVGAGVGAALYHALESKAARLKISRLHAFVSESAKSFFIKMNWTLVKTQTVERHGVA